MSPQSIATLAIILVAVLYVCLIRVLWLWRTGRPPDLALKAQALQDEITTSPELGE